MKKEREDRERKIDEQFDYLAQQQWWKPSSGRFFTSFMPVYRIDHDTDICWHGCDKVSRIESYGGGGS